MSRVDLPAPTLPSTEMVRGLPEGLVSNSLKEGSESPRRNKEGAGTQEIRGTIRLRSQRGDMMMIMSSQVRSQ